MDIMNIFIKHIVEVDMRGPRSDVNGKTGWPLPVTMWLSLSDRRPQIDIKLNFQQHPQLPCSINLIYKRLALLQCSTLHKLQLTDVWDVRNYDSNICSIILLKDGGKSSTKHETYWMLAWHHEPSLSSEWDQLMWLDICRLTEETATSQIVTVTHF